MAWLKSARAASDWPMRSSSRPRALKDSALAWSRAMACPKSVSASRRLQGQASKHTLLKWGGLHCSRQKADPGSPGNAGAGAWVVSVWVGNIDLGGGGGGGPAGRPAAVSQHLVSVGMEALQGRPPSGCGNMQAGVDMLSQRGAPVGRQGRSQVAACLRDAGPKHGSQRLMLRTPHRLQGQAGAELLLMSAL